MAEEEKTTLVSIIISSYNYAPYLRQAIDSALQQDYPLIEVIVVDDGSTDESPAIIKEYGDRIKPVLKENGGQASSMNEGFGVSHGEIVIFLDSDDVIYPEAVSLIAPLFSGDKISKVHWLLDEIDTNGKRTHKVFPKFALAEGDLLHDLIASGPEKGGNPPYSPPTSGNAWHKNYLRAVMPIPENEYKSNTDQYLHFLAPVYGEIRAFHQPLGAYRVHGQNYSLKPISEYAGEYLVRYEHICGVIERHLQEKDIRVESSKWPRNTWFHQILAGIEDIKQVVPENKSFVLADENAWGIDGAIEERKRYHLMRNGNEYNGPPADDEQAIKELESDRSEGADYVFFTSNAFWWLDYYEELSAYLKNNCDRVLKNERLIGFHFKEN